MAWAAHQLAKHFDQRLTHAAAQHNLAQRVAAAKQAAAQHAQAQWQQQAGHTTRMADFLQSAGTGALVLTGSIVAFYSVRAAGSLASRGLAALARGLSSSSPSSAAAAAAPVAQAGPPAGPMVCFWTSGLPVRPPPVWPGR